MNINASLIDQRITGITESWPEWFAGYNDTDKKRSAAFTLLCVSIYFNLSLEEALELLTDGGNDAGVDALNIGELEDDAFTVTLFQGKYKRDLSGEANFPENGVQKACNTLQVLFDPYRAVSLNKKIEPKIEEIRSLIRDGNIPAVRVILCNNGSQWTEAAQHWIDRAKKEYGDKVQFVHFNHDSIVQILQRPEQVDTTLNLSGKAIDESMNFMRVFVGRIAVQEIARLFDLYGDALLAKNIRRYLGLHKNFVNKGIRDTLINSEQSDKFYCYNNGVTVVCDHFDYNAFQESNYQLQIKNMQVINGGQTCKTIQETLKETSNQAVGKQAYAMIRIYQLADTQKDILH